jgi:uncharacterized protein (DUF58 family)
MWKAAFLQTKHKLLHKLEKRLPALTRYRQVEPIPIVLHKRRIYIIPTRFGVLFAVLLIVMLLGGLNFNNNAALMLTFTLSGVVLLSLPRTVTQLNQLALISVHAAPVFAGQDLSWHFVFRSNSANTKHQLCLSHTQRSIYFDLLPGDSTVTLSQHVTQRGWLSPGRHTLSTQTPFGFFYAWSVINPNYQALVYPQPEAQAPPWPLAEQTSKDKNTPLRAHSDQWRGVRHYQKGDPSKQIAWKISARQNRLLVNEFSTTALPILELSYQHLSTLDHEHRISRLTRWCLEANAQNIAFSLILPHLSLGPDQGSTHLSQCLRELALLP